MINIDQLTKFLNDNNTEIVSISRQAITITTDLQNNKITQQESIELLNDLSSQELIANDAQSITLKEKLDEAISDIITTIKIIPIP